MSLLRAGVKIDVIIESYMLLLRANCTVLYCNTDIKSQQIDASIYCHQAELKQTESMGSMLPEQTRISPGTPMTRTNANGVSTMVPYFSSLGSYLNGSINIQLLNPAALYYKAL